MNREPDNVNSNDGKRYGTKSRESCQKGQEENKFKSLQYAFYLNAFFDMGFVDNMYPMPELNNDLENTLLIGYGIGLDFVTYYDIVLRFEYSVNRMGEHGFYLHFRAPI